MAKAMQNVFVANGLECKISCKTSKVSIFLYCTHLQASFIFLKGLISCVNVYVGALKVSYVLDTEDLLFRRKRKRVDNINALSDNFISRRVLKFRRWIDHYNQKKDR